jgi:hypothetical protein
VVAVAGGIDVVGSYDGAGPVATLLRLRLVRARLSGTLAAWSGSG